VEQLQHALDEIYRQQGQSIHHDYQANWQLLDVDMTGLRVARKRHLLGIGLLCRTISPPGTAGGPRPSHETHEEVVVDRLGCLAMSNWSKHYSH
jgi:hypothetical protein